MIKFASKLGNSAMVDLMRHFEVIKYFQLIFDTRDIHIGRLFRDANPSYRVKCLYTLSTFLLNVSSFTLVARIIFCGCILDKVLCVRKSKSFIRDDLIAFVEKTLQR
jgi:hypothetical protein